MKRTIREKGLLINYDRSPKERKKSTKRLVTSSISFLAILTFATACTSNDAKTSTSSSQTKIALTNEPYKGLSKDLTNEIKTADKTLQALKEAKITSSLTDEVKKEATDSIDKISDKDIQTAYRSIETVINNPSSENLQLMRSEINALPKKYGKLAVAMDDAYTLDMADYISKNVEPGKSPKEILKDTKPLTGKDLTDKKETIAKDKAAAEKAEKDRITKEKAAADKKAADEKADAEAKKAEEERKTAEAAEAQRQADAAAAAEAERQAAAANQSSGQPAYEEPQSNYTPPAQNSGGNSNNYTPPVQNNNSGSYTPPAQPDPAPTPAPAPTPTKPSTPPTHVAGDNAPNGYEMGEGVW